MYISYIYIQLFGKRDHEGNMEGTCVNKSDSECFQIESQNLHSKETTTFPDKNQTLTKLEWNMREQGGGGALQRAAAPLIWHGRIYLCHRFIFVSAGILFSFE